MSIRADLQINESPFQRWAVLYFMNPGALLQAQDECGAYGACPYARKAPVWPDLIGRRKVSIEWNKRLLDTLEVGKESPLRGQANHKAPATQTTETAVQRPKR